MYISKTIVLISCGVTVQLTCTFVLVHAESRFSHDVAHANHIMKKSIYLPGAKLLIYEPRSEKTGLRGFRPGPTQTKLHSDRRWLEA